MLNLLPKWFLQNTRSSFHDRDSVTLLELAGTLHGKMNELIADYNQFIEGANKKIEDFTASTEADKQVFATALRQEFQDFIDIVNIKVEEINLFIKQNFDSKMQDIINEYVATGAVDALVKNNLKELNAEVKKIKAEKDNFKAEITEENNTFKAEITEGNNNFKLEMQDQFDLFDDNVGDFKEEVQNRLLNDREIMADWVNEESQPAQQLLMKDKVLFEGEMDYLGSPVEITRDILKYSVCMVQVDDYTCLCSVNKSANSCTLFGFGLMNEASAESVVIGVANIAIGDVVETLSDGTKETHFKIIYNKSASWSLYDGGVNSWDGIPLLKITGIY